MTSINLALQAVNLDARQAASIETRLPARSDTFVLNAARTAEAGRQAYVELLLDRIEEIMALASRQGHRYVTLVNLGSEFDDLPIEKPGVVARFLRGGLSNVANPSFKSDALDSLWSGLKELGLKPFLTKEIHFCPIDPPGPWKEYYIAVSIGPVLRSTAA